MKQKTTIKYVPCKHGWQAANYGYVLEYSNGVSVTKPDNKIMFFPTRFDAKLYQFANELN